jgi:RNase P subunit RPR2
MISRIKWLSCPGCQHPILYTNNSTISVNVESEQLVSVECLWLPVEGCDNPFCKWSKVNFYR